MRFLLPCLLFGLAGAAVAQYPGLTLPPSGNNQKASVTQFIGPVSVNIVYSSPSVHSTAGVDRRGQIWGKLVPFGMTPFAGFGNGKPSPWRAGANENTVFTVSNDVKIQGQLLPAGRYGLHMIPGQDEWTIIFSKNSSSWGSFFYDEKDDALRVKTTSKKHEYREWLAYEFTERRPNQATAELQWEDLSIPWTIQVDNVNDIYVTRLRQELTSVPGFDPKGYDAAAQYTIQANANLEQGLIWAEQAVSGAGIGQANFNTLSTKALLLSKLGRDAEAKTVMETALKLPGTTPFEIHQYGRLLQNAKKNTEALEVFKYNAQRNGDAWPTNVGLARGYAGVGDNAKALEYAKKAVVQAPDDLNRKNLEDMVKRLSAGQQIN